jgi:hypothetical protein
MANWPIETLLSSAELKQALSFPTYLTDFTKDNERRQGEHDETEMWGCRYWCFLAELNNAKAATAVHEIRNDHQRLLRERFLECCFLMHSSWSVDELMRVEDTSIRH